MAITVALAVASVPGQAGPAAADTIRIVAFGDSLVAGYELPPAAAFPVRLEAALRERGHDVEIVNSGASGETSSAGLQRLDWAIPEDADGVIVEYGANDALRGIDPERTRETMDRLVERLTERGHEVLLAGMQAPPNMGADYAEAFNAIYPEIAERHDVLLYPFFLEGVAAQADLNLDDGMHPNEAGVEVIVENILPAVEDLISRIEARAS